MAKLLLTTLEQEIQLRRIKDRVMVDGTITQPEDIIFCQEMEPLYVQVFRADKLPDRTSEPTKDDPMYVITIGDQDSHDNMEDSYEFSMDAIEVLAMIAKTCKEVWIESLLKED
jgi:hypothetical protein